MIHCHCISTQHHASVPRIMIHCHCISTQHHDPLSLHQYPASWSTVTASVPSNTHSQQETCRVTLWTAVCKSVTSHSRLHQYTVIYEPYMLYSGKLTRWTAIIRDIHTTYTHIQTFSNCTSLTADLHASINSPGNFSRPNSPSTLPWQCIQTPIKPTLTLNNYYRHYSTSISCSWQTHATCCCTTEKVLQKIRWTLSVINLQPN